MLSNEWYYQLIEYNVSILLINLLPIWPLDGGKLFFCIVRRVHRFDGRTNKRFMLPSFFSHLFRRFIDQRSIAHEFMDHRLLFSACHLDGMEATSVCVDAFLLERYYGKRVEYRALKRLVVDANDSLFHVLLLFHRGKNMRLS